jgi:hypothetical protein
MINQDIIAQDLFYKIRSRFPKMEMGDGDGQPTFEATKGRLFDFDAVFEGTNLGTVSISINEPGSLKIYFNRNILEDVDSIISKTWYNFLKEMRRFAMKRLMSFDTRDISKTNLDKRDYGYLAKKESVMNESLMKGTSRTSYKPLEKTRLIIRHSKTVDESIPGARSRNIEALFIENAIGERYKYPFNHKVGAEAMQRHVANGGLPHDPVGKKIIEMSEDIAKLKSFKHYVQKEDLMNTQNNHIVERATAKLESLKGTMAKLSRQHHYEEFKNSFGTAVSSDDQPLMDQITLEDYKDKFTVKSFKEDIADIFPLIHRIMQENSDIDLEEVAQLEDTAEEFSLEDLVSESPDHQFDTWTTTLIETRLTPEEINSLKDLLSEHFPVGINGDSATGALEELGINLSNEVKQQLAQLAESEGPDSDAKGLVIEYLSQYEPEVYGALDLEVAEGKTGLPALAGKAINKLGNIGKDVAWHANPKNLFKLPPDFKPLPKDADQGDGALELANVAARLGIAGTALGGTAIYQKNKAEKNQEQGFLPGEMGADGKPRYLTPDELADFDKLSKDGADLPVKENSDQTPEERKAAAEYMAKAAQAIRSGEVKPEDIESEFFNTLPMMGVSDEKTYAAWDRITNHSGQQKPKNTMSDKDIDAQLKGIDNDEDDDAQFITNLKNQAKSGGIKQDNTGFGAEVNEREGTAQEGKGDSSSMKKVAEFIMGFYDRNTGNFPLGETGVAIKVQKEFGDKAGELAERLIQKMANQNQVEQTSQQMFEDLKKLSGQIKSSGLTAINKSPTTTKKINEGTEHAELQRLAGIGIKTKATGKSSEVFDLKKLAGI